jgi:hypothetical protein
VFEKRRREAESKTKNLKFIAEYKEGRAKIGIKSVGVESPFYN